MVTQNLNVYKFSRDRHFNQHARDHVLPVQKFLLHPGMKSAQIGVAMRIHSLTRRPHVELRVVVAVKERSRTLWPSSNQNRGGGRLTPCSRSLLSPEGTASCQNESGEARRGRLKQSAMPSRPSVAACIRERLRNALCNGSFFKVRRTVHILIEF